MNNLSFYEVIERYKDLNIKERLKNVTKNDVRRSLANNKFTIDDFLNLISKEAEEFIEEMAVIAREITLKHFGRTILLYTPLYLSNYCVNKCTYCGYNVENKIKRKKLTLEEVEEEAKVISSKGFKHILILTGESSGASPVEYIIQCVEILKKYFDSIGIEIYPLTEEEYKKVVEAGVDNLTVYHEVYNEEIYKKVHLKGPKSDYKFRLDALERGAKAGMRNVNFGALLGLNDFREEMFYVALHGLYIQENYGEVDLGFSFPRIKAHQGEFDDIIPVSDVNLVQAILAIRLLFHSGGISISTRESKEMRDNLLPIGVTKMSAYSTTEVGGHSQEDKGEEQFEISDSRTVEEFKAAIISKGYQPIFKDWVRM